MNYEYVNMYYIHEVYATTKGIAAEKLAIYNTMITIYLTLICSN